MADVARRAGVSASTVSYALSGRKPVSAQARHRVMRAVEELGYRRNAAARALASRRTRTLALVVPPLGEGLVATQLEFVAAVAEEASRHEYDVLLASSRDAEAGIARLVQGGVVDGLIVMEVRLDDPRVELLRRYRVPFVLIGRPADTTGLRYVDADTGSMLRRAVEYLYGLGHRRIAFVNLPEPLLAVGYAPAVRGLDGYRAACESAGLTPVALACDVTTDGTAQCVADLLDREPAVTAIASTNDDAVAGLVAALHAAGRRVPEDISVLGIIGPTRARQLTRPALTVVALPTAEMATAAAQRLIAAVEGKDDAAEPGLLFDPPLTEGASCAPPPARPPLP
jgi:DNA-binding LacI/PurR family transcriptional regulator